MTKRLFFIFLLAFTMQYGFSQNIQFNDYKFKQALLANDPEAPIDQNGDGQISVNEASVYSEEINVSGYGITNVEEIKYFKSARSFHCANNLITSLDLSQNTELKILYCDNNQIQNIIFAYVRTFTSVKCNNNQLASLNIPNTSVLEASNNPLTNLNISRCTSLQDIRIINGQLKSIDLSIANDLRYIDLSNNQLVNFTSGFGTKMQYFNCSNNQLTSLDASNLEGGSTYSTFNCSNNQINDIKAPKKAINIDCSNNMLALGALWEIKKNASNLVTFNYNNQKLNTTATTHELGFEYTCSEEPTMDGKTTVFAWYKDNSPISLTGGNGKYEFTTIGNYYYTCTNAIFPGITSKVYVTVTENTHTDQEITIGELPAWIEKGYSKQFNATASSGLKVTYTVTPSTCVVWANGQITFNELGVYTIVLTQAGNATYNPAPSKTFTVTVKKGQNNIRLKERDWPDEYFVNDEYRFRAYSGSSSISVATIEPNTDVDYRYQRTGQHFFTFHKEGYYTIRFNASGDDEHEEAEEVVRTIYVKKKDLKVTYEYYGTLPEDGEIDKYYNFKPRIKPVKSDPNAPTEVHLQITPNTYTYPTDTEMIKFHEGGTYTIKVFNDGNEEYYPIEDYVSIIISTPTSIEDEENKDVKIYPNPASDYITIEGLALLGKYAIYDFTGKKVDESMIPSDYKIYIANLNAGIYFIKLGNNEAKKFIKK